MAIDLGNKDKAPKAPIGAGRATSQKANAEAAVARPVEDDKEYGQKSETLSLVATLVNPTDFDNRTVGEAKEKVQSFRIVGYRLKSTEDITIPDAGTPKDLKAERMAFENPQGTRAVKAGEEFDLTPFEIAALLAREEYNGTFGTKETGGVYSANYKQGGKKTRDGAVETVQSAAIPTVTVRASAGGSIHDAPAVEIGTSEERKGSGDRVTRILTLKPEFSKWGALAIRRQRTASASGAKTVQKNRRSDGAEAFLSMVNSIKA